MSKSKFIDVTSVINIDNKRITIKSKSNQVLWDVFYSNTPELLSQYTIGNKSHHCKIVNGKIDPTTIPDNATWLVPIVNVPGLTVSSLESMKSTRILKFGQRSLLRVSLHPSNTPMSEVVAVFNSFPITPAVIPVTSPTDTSSINTSSNKTSSISPNPITTFTSTSTSTSTSSSTSNSVSNTSSTKSSEPSLKHHTARLHIVQAAISSLHCWLEELEASEQFPKAILSLLHIITNAANAAHPLNAKTESGNLSHKQLYLRTGFRCGCHINPGIDKVFLKWPGLVVILSALGWKSVRGRETCLCDDSEPSCPLSATKHCLNNTSISTSTSTSTSTSSSSNNSTIPLFPVVDTSLPPSLTSIVEYNELNNTNHTDTSDNINNANSPNNQAFGDGVCVLQRHSHIHDTCSQCSSCYVCGYSIDAKTLQLVYPSHSHSHSYSITNSSTPICSCHAAWMYLPPSNADDWLLRRVISELHSLYDYHSQFIKNKNAIYIPAPLRVHCKCKSVPSKNDVYHQTDMMDEDEVEREKEDAICPGGLTVFKKMLCEMLLSMDDDALTRANAIQALDSLHILLSAAIDSPNTNTNINTNSSNNSKTNKTPNHVVLKSKAVMGLVYWLSGEIITDESDNTMNDADFDFDSFIHPQPSPNNQSDLSVSVPSLSRNKMRVVKACLEIVVRLQKEYVQVSSDEDVLECVGVRGKMDRDSSIAIMMLRDQTSTGDSTSFEDSIVNNIGVGVDTDVDEIPDYISNDTITHSMSNSNSNNSIERYEPDNDANLQPGAPSPNDIDNGVGVGVGVGSPTNEEKKTASTSKSQNAPSQSHSHSHFDSDSDSEDDRHALMALRRVMQHKRHQEHLLIDSTGRMRSKEEHQHALKVHRRATSVYKECIVRVQFPYQSDSLFTSSSFIVQGRFHVAEHVKNIFAWTQSFIKPVVDDQWRAWYPAFALMVSPSDAIYYNNYKGATGSGRGGNLRNRDKMPFGSVDMYNWLDVPLALGETWEGNNSGLSVEDKQALSYVSLRDCSLGSRVTFRLRYLGYWTRQYTSYYVATDRNREDGIGSNIDDDDWKHHSLHRQWITECDGDVALALNRTVGSGPISGGKRVPSNGPVMVIHKGGLALSAPTDDDFSCVYLNAPFAGKSLPELEIGRYESIESSTKNTNKSTETNTSLKNTSGASGLRGKLGMLRNAGSAKAGVKKPMSAEEREAQMLKKMGF